MKRPPSVPHLRLADLRTSLRAESWSGLLESRQIRYTYSGRGAIYQYLSMLRRVSTATTRQIVLVPAFHCPTVVDPILHAGYEVRFYAIDRGLRVVADDLLQKLDNDVAAVIFIRYFGFADLDPRLAAACRDAGAKVIEDCCHSFLSANPMRYACSGADATIYSFWKLIPSWVGGGVLLASPSPDDAWSRQRPPSTRDTYGRSKILVRQLLDEQHESWFRHLNLRYSDPGDEANPVPAVRKTSEEAYPYDELASSWRMPITASWILRHANLSDVIDGRRRNFEMMAARLQTSLQMSPVYPRLAPDTCPWGFPVLLEKRAERDFLIRAKGVPVFTFGEVVHPLLFDKHKQESRMLETVKYLSDSLLVFAIHQRLEEGQVKEAAATINEFMAHL